MPMTNYEKSKLKTAQMKAQYGEDPDMWPDGVRPADQAKEQQLIGGPADDDLLEHQDYEGNVFNMADEYQGANKATNDIMGGFTAATNMISQNLIQGFSG